MLLQFCWTAAVAAASSSASWTFPKSSDSTALPCLFSRLPRERPAASRMEVFFQVEPKYPVCFLQRRFFSADNPAHCVSPCIGVGWGVVVGDRVSHAPELWGQGVLQPDRWGPQLFFPALDTPLTKGIPEVQRCHYHVDNRVFHENIFVK